MQFPPAPLSAVVHPADDRHTDRMRTSRILIDTTPFGGRIEVNGDDVTDQVGLAEIRVANGQPTTLSLHLLADGKIEGDAVVHVIDHQPTPEGIDTDMVVAFLDSIDPDRLDHDALNNADASSNLTAVMLDTLKGYARAT